MTIAPDGGSAGLTMGDGLDWRSYVEGTRSKYVSRYAGVARWETNSYAKLEAELGNLMNAAQQAGVQRAYGTVLEMAEWLWSDGGQFLDLRGHIQEGAQLLAQAVDAARFLGEKNQEEHLLGQLGRAWMALGKVRAAAESFERALTIAEKIGDRRGEASHLGNLGQIELEQKNLAKAADHFQKAMKIAREVGDRRMEGRLGASLGLVKLRSQILSGYTREATTEAIQDFMGAVAIARETGDRRGEASHLGCIGGAYELMASMSVSLPPFVWGSPYPADDSDRHERYQKQLEQANRESYLEAYEYFSHALSIANEIDDKEAQERLDDDRRRVGLKAGLPLYSSGGDVNYNIWVRNQKPSSTGRVPGTRHQHEKSPLEAAIRPPVVKGNSLP